MLWFILEIQCEKGNPLSLEKAQSSRDVVASAVMFPEKIRKKRRIERKSATPVEPVLVNRLRYGAGDSKTASSGPMQKSMVISMRTPMKTLTTKDHHMQRGTTSDASSTSSDIWTIESDPS